MGTYALTRLQATHGTWYWAVKFKRKGKPCYRRFYEPMYGGSENARRAAIEWRNQQLAKVAPTSVVEFCQMVRRNNTSGVPGVHFLKTPKQPQGLWQAKLKLHGKAIHKSFSVKRYGDEQAFRLAIAARNNMLAGVPDRPYLYDVVAIAKAASFQLD